MAEPHPSTLAERLLRRRADPIGVIDARAVVQRYERAAAWPRRHLAVLDRSVSRTSLDAQPERRLPLTLVAAGATAGAREPLDTSPTAPLERNLRTPSAVPAVMRQWREARASSVARDIDRREADVARTAAPRAAASPAASSPTTVIGPAMHAVSRFAVERRSASTPVPPDDSSPILRGPAQRAQGRQHEAVSHRVRADEWPGPPVVREAIRPPESAGVDSMPPAASPVWRARAATVRTSDASSVASALRSTAPTPAQPLVQRRVGTGGTTPATAPHGTLAMQTSRASAEPAEMHPGRAGQPAVRRSVPGAVPERSPLGSSIETIYDRALPASPVGARIARASAPARRSSGAVAAMPLAAPTDSAAPRDDMRAAFAVAGAEPATAVPDSSARPPAQMVWRRSPPHDANAISRSATASAPVNAGSSTGGGFVLEPPPAGRIDSPAGTPAPAAGMTPPARQSSAAVNIEQLAQEVMRRILEQVAIERERIGEPWR